MRGSTVYSKQETVRRFLFTLQNILQFDLMLNVYLNLMCNTNVLFISFVGSERPCDVNLQLGNLWWNWTLVPCREVHH